MVGARKSIHNVEEGDWKTYFTHETRMPNLCLTSFTEWIMSVHVCWGRGWGGGGGIGRTFCVCEVVSVTLQTQRKSFRASNNLNWQEMQSQPTSSLTLVTKSSVDCLPTVHSSMPPPIYSVFYVSPFLPWSPFASGTYSLDQLEPGGLSKFYLFRWLMGEHVTSLVQSG